MTGFVETQDGERKEEDVVALTTALGEGLRAMMEATVRANERHEASENARVRGLMAPTEARAWLAAWEAAYNAGAYGCPVGKPTAEKYWRKGADNANRASASAVQFAAWRRCGEPDKGYLVDHAVVTGRFWNDMRRLAKLDD
jgi:hypothetical protein